MVKTIRHIELDFLIEFETPAYFDVYPSFALRSVLGKWLREMHCVCKGERCSDCPFLKTCAFAFVFETPIDKESESLKGRDRAGHPFRIISAGQPGQRSTNLRFRIQLLGKGTEYIPHVAFAFREAGKAGLFRQRVRYSIKELRCQGRNILDGNRIKSADLPDQTVSIEESPESLEEGSFEVICNTPLRFKTRGNYNSDFQAGDFLEACSRRVRMLAEFFGEPAGFGIGYAPKSDPVPSIDAILSDRRLRWAEYVHWSARQKTTMKLGGHVGRFCIQGTAHSFHWNALRICGLLGAGKSTSFGFGDITIHDRSNAGGKAP